MQQRNLQDGTSRFIRWVFAVNLILSFLRFESAVCSSKTDYDPPVTPKTGQVFERAEYIRDFFPSTDILRQQVAVSSPFQIFGGRPKDRFPRGKPILIQEVIQNPNYFFILQKRQRCNSSDNDGPHLV